MFELAFYLALGLVVGCLGTIIGAGGGFLLMPVLLFMFPDRTPEQLTAISLFAVACNATSGSLTYLVRKRVHIPSAILFTLAGVPGAWFGVHLASLIDREQFNVVFATLITILGIYLLFKKGKSSSHTDFSTFSITRKQMLLGMAISFGVGAIASFLGIGGGIIHVPMLSEFLSFPVHLATGTSHSILACTSIVATIHHIVNGTISFSEPFLWALGAGMVSGAQIGARVAQKIKAEVILRILGVVLLLVAARLLFVTLSS